MVKRSREESLSPLPDEHSEYLSTTEVVSPPFEGLNARSIKYLHVEESELPVIEGVMICSLPPHRQPISFASYEAYEIHYAKLHTNRCSECRKNFPTEHFLNLHIEENHDSLIEARRARGEKTYSCFIEDCERKCSTAPKRRSHLIDKHMFPKDYDFLFVKNGIDQRSSFLKSRSGHRRRSSASQIALAEQRARRRSTTQEISESKRDANISENDVLITSKPPTAETSLVAADTSLETTLPPITAPFSEIIPSTSPEQIKRPDDPINALSNSMATLKLVPRTIKFGRGRGKGGLSNY